MSGQVPGGRFPNRIGMNILVTGAAGFLGRDLVGRLRRERPGATVVAVDQTSPVGFDPGVVALACDIRLPERVSRLVQEQGPFSSVWHLAAVVSGSAESDFDLGWSVNLDGTRNLCAALRGQAETTGVVARVTFTSSVAVFGGPMPDVIVDTTVATPQWSYGMQKLACEILLGDFTRKGFLDGRALRLPTVSVRPGKPNGALSSFASGIIREPLAGLDADLPVPVETALWLISPEAAVDALLYTDTIDRDRFHEGLFGRGLNLPGLTVTVAQMLDALRDVAGDATLARVRHSPDPRVEAVVGNWPARFDTARADALGYRADTDFREIVVRHRERMAANA